MHIIVNFIFTINGLKIFKFNGRDTQLGLAFNTNLPNSNGFTAGSMSVKLCSSDNFIFSLFWNNSY